MADKFTGRRGGAQGPGARSPTVNPEFPAQIAGRAPASRPTGASLGRARAKVAWDWVGDVERRFPGENGEKSRNRYGTLARKLPALLQVSGLGQTLAFLFSKGGRKADKPENLLFTQLADHLRSRLHPAPEGDFMRAVLDLSPGAYRNATREALAVADWLKRFAEGQLGSEDE